jgi:predicted metalloprotease
VFAPSGAPAGAGGCRSGGSREQRRLATALRLLRCVVLNKLAVSRTNGARIMDFRNGRESDNIEDRRGQGRRGLGGGGKIGIGTIVLALVAMYFGIDPSVVLNTAMTDPAPIESAQPRTPAEEAQARFVSMVLADTEDTWNVIFREGGATYREPRLVLFEGQVQSACGARAGSVGPFYCPGDERSTSTCRSTDVMREQFGAPATSPRPT